jgi:hypothetical protein
MKSVLLGVAVLLASAWNQALVTGRIANASDLPLLQEGSARTAFVSGAYETCMEGRRSSQRMPVSRLRSLVNIVSVTEGRSPTSSLQRSTKLS